MKKKIVILGVAIAPLTLGVATFAITNNTNKEAKPLDAEAYNDKTSVQNGLFVKVTDVIPDSGEGTGDEEGMEDFLIPILI